MFRMPARRSGHYAPHVARRAVWELGVGGLESTRRHLRPNALPNIHDALHNTRTPGCSPASPALATLQLPRNPARATLHALCRWRAPHLPRSPPCRFANVASLGAGLQQQAQRGRRVHAWVLEVPALRKRRRNTGGRQEHGCGTASPHCNRQAPRSHITMRQLEAKSKSETHDKKRNSTTNAVPNISLLEHLSTRAHIGVSRHLSFLMLL